MKHLILMSTAILLSVSASAQISAPAAATQATTESHPVSPKEMLVIGASPMKLHALSRIAPGNMKGVVDESYLPGFKICAEDPDDLVRRLTAKLLGQYFVAGRKIPNPEAVTLLVQLAKDKSSFVRDNAVYYGLSVMDEKSPEIIELLIDVASTERDALMNEYVNRSLKNYPDETVRILNEKLKTDEALLYFEVYEELSGKKPVATDRLLDMPSSRPVMFVFNGGEKKNAKFRADLERELKALGLDNPEMYDSGADDSYAVMVKTYMTRDRVSVENAFANHAEFPPAQRWWLTPELDIQFEDWRNK